MSGRFIPAQSGRKDDWLQIQYDSGKAGLQNQNSRYADNEIPVLCFMTEEIHPRKGSDRSTQKGGKEQGSLRDPPLVSSCPLLVHSHKRESKKIQDDQINKKQTGN